MFSLDAVDSRAARLYDARMRWLACTVILALAPEAFAQKKAALLPWTGMAESAWSSRELADDWWLADYWSLKPTRTIAAGETALARIARWGDFRRRDLRSFQQADQAFAIASICDGRALVFEDPGDHCRYPLRVEGKSLKFAHKDDLPLHCTDGGFACRYQEGLPLHEPLIHRLIKKYDHSVHLFEGGNVLILILHEVPRDEPYFPARCRGTLPILVFRNGPPPRA